LLHQAEEACCDAWVVWLLPQRARDYARALLETIDFLTPAPDAPLLSSGFGRASTLKRRFDMILRQHASHRLSWPARIGVAAAGLLVLPWSLTTLAADDPTTPPATPTAPQTENLPSAGNPASGLPTPTTPPRAENAASELPPVAPRDETPRAEATPPAGAPSLPPSASSSAPLTPPLPSAQATAPAALPTPAVGARLTVGPPTSEPALAPMPTTPPVGPGAGTPPTADPGAPANTTPMPGATPAVPRSERGAGDPRVLARLERLEATTAELLMLVKQLRDERQPGPKSYRGVKDVPVKEYAVPSQFGMRYGHGDRQLLIEVAGRQVTASDASGKVMWTNEMPWNISAVQGANNNLVASGFNGGQAVIDPNNGSVKVTNEPVVGNYGGGESRPAKVSAPVDPTIAARDDAKAADIAAKRAQEIATIEMDMLAVERKLAQERAELQHRIRQMETRRARLARKLDSLTSDTGSDDRLKLTAELEEAEDQLASTEHEADVFEADLEFKIREIQLKRDQLLRSQGFDPRDASPAKAQPKRASALIQR
jgi:hypothetical protein